MSLESVWRSRGRLQAGKAMARRQRHTKCAPLGAIPETPLPRLRPISLCGRESRGVCHTRSVCEAFLPPASQSSLTPSTDWSAPTLPLSATQGPQKSHQAIMKLAILPPRVLALVLSLLICAALAPALATSSGTQRTSSIRSECFKLPLECIYSRRS